MRKVKSYKCPVCKKIYDTLGGWGNHLEQSHPETIPEDYTVSRYFYYILTGRTQGKCIMCGKETLWKEASGKYDRFCIDPKCKKAYREMFKKRMIKARGKVHLLNDPEVQRNMLRNRKISGRYVFDDGGIVEFVGTYERDFLQMLDNFGFESGEVMGPSPHTYTYTYEGKEHFYIPDYYIPTLNLEIEVKQNQSTHHKILAVDKIKEQEKDKVMSTISDVKYVKVVDKSYVEFLQFLLSIKEENAFKDSKNAKNNLSNAIATETFSELLQNEPMIIDVVDYIDTGVSIDEIATESISGTDISGLYPVYVLLVHSGTAFSNLIQFFTRGEFSHASIGFDPSLTKQYSFGSKIDDSPHTNKSITNTGFIMEDISAAIYNKNEVPYGLYVVFVNASELALIKKKIKYFIENESKLKYHIEGCVKAFVNISNENAKKYFCSGFVADILNSGRRQFNQSYSLIKPMDIPKGEDVILVSNGLLSQYKPANTLKTIEKLKKEELKRRIYNKSKFAANESKLTTEDRQQLTSSEFGIPDERKYPLNDENHVIAAIKMFRNCKPIKRRTLAMNISKAIKKFNMDIDLSKNELISDYL